MWLFYLLFPHWHHLAHFIFFQWLILNLLQWFGLCRLVVFRYSSEAPFSVKARLQSEVMKNVYRLLLEISTLWWVVTCRSIRTEEFYNFVLMRTHLTEQVGSVLPLTTRICRQCDGNLGTLCRPLPLYASCGWSRCQREETAVVKTLIIRLVCNFLWVVFPPQPVMWWSGVSEWMPSTPALSLRKGMLYPDQTQWIPDPCVRARVCVWAVWFSRHTRTNKSMFP